MAGEELRGLLGRVPGFGELKSMCASAKKVDELCRAAGLARDELELLAGSEAPDEGCAPDGAWILPEE